MDLNIFKELFNSNSNDMLYQMDLPSGEYKFVSDSSIKLFGYEPEIFYNEPILIQKAIHPESLDYFEEMWEKLLDGYAPDYYEYKIIRKDGEIRWLNQRNYLEKDKGGKVTGIKGIVTDITEDILVKKSLQESKFKYQTFVDKSYGAVHRWDYKEPLPLDLSFEEQIKWTMKYQYLAECNTFLAKYYGFETTEEILGMSLNDLIQNEEVVREIVEEFIRKDYTWNNVITHEFNKDGKEYYFLNNLVSVIEDNHIHSLWVTQIDITEQIKFEDKLKESEKRFRDISETMQDWIWEVNAEGKYTYVGDGLYDILGYNSEEIIGKTVLDLMPLEDRKIQQKEHKKHKSNPKEFHNLLNRNLHKNGSIVYLESSAIPMFDDSNNFIGYRGIDRDITEKKRFEAERESLIVSLKKQKELLERQSTNAKIGYWTIDVDTNKITWSREILKIYELEKEPEHNNIFTLKQSIHTEDINKLVSSLEKAKIDPSYRHDITYRIVLKDTIKWVHCQGRLNPDDNKVEGTLQDVTELITTKFELEKQKELIVSQSKAAMMGEMISLIAHQWKQPLSILSMLGANIRLDAELGTLSRNEIVNSIDDIDKQVKHLSHTIDTFSNFLKPNQSLVLTTVENVIDSSLEIVNKSLVNNNIELIKEFNTNVELTVNASELIQVIINLLNNSKDAFKLNNIDERKLWIRTYKEENKIYIEIEDTAGGIPTDKINKIFNAYFTTKSKSGGTGLGLYIVKTIIEDHCNGTIEVQNTHIGAKFIITLSV